MPRNYDSSRRTQAANRTREAILAAAFRQHGLGVVDMDELAREADVSVATIRKHFPTRELLFEGCTDYGLHQVTMPDVPAIAMTADPVARTRLAVDQTFAVYEAMYGQLWGAFRLEDESPVMKTVIAQVEGLTAAIAGLVVEAWGADKDKVGEKRGLTVALLNPLAHRALRRFGGLTPEQAVQLTTETLLLALGSSEGRESLD